MEKGVRDEHGRKTVYDGDGKTFVMSQDKKILKNSYVAKSDKSDLIRKDSKTAQQSTVEMLETQLNSAKAAFNEQMKQDGWAGDVADGVSKIWNNDLFGGGTGNTASQVREEFKTYQKNLNDLKTAAKQGDGAFKAKFKQIYGIEYNQKAIADYNMNPTEANYQKAFGKKNNIAQRVAKYNSSQQTGATVVKTGAELGITTGVTVAADALDIVTFGLSTPLSAAAIGATTFVADVLVEGTDKYKFTGEYKDADGNIVKDDGNFRDGTNWGEIAKEAGTDAAIAASTFGIGKYATSAYKIGKASVAASKVERAAEKVATSAAKAETGLVKTTEKVAEKAVEKTTEKVAEKAATKTANTTVSKAEQAAIETASDVGVSAAADYAQNGEVTLEGVALNAAVGSAGFAAERLAGKIRGMKKGSHASETGKSTYVTQEAPTTGRNEIADAEVARNIDQSHLNGRDREMVAREMDAQATPTPAEMEAYAKEHAYQAPTPEERAALDAHKAEVQAEYADAHKIENNATIKQQTEPKAPASADAAKIKNIENEISGLDGQLKQLNRQLAGAKQAKRMGRKNDATITKLEEQIEKLNQQRNAKITELNAAKKAGNTANVENTANTANTAETPKSEQKNQTVSAKDRMSMMKISIGINKADSFDDLNKLARQLEQIPDCNQKRNLLKQLNLKKTGILREIYHPDFDNVAALRAQYPQYRAMTDKQLLDYFKLDEKHADFVTSRKDLFKAGEAKYKERAYWNDSPYELTNNHSAWKMHLYSVDELDYQQMAEIVLPYLNEHKIAHKTLSSTMSPELLSRSAPQQTGKAFTIYPQSKEEMAQIAKDLDRLIREHNLTTNSSHISGDNQMGSSGRLFYRYEFPTGKLKDKIYKPGESAPYDANRGEGKYLAPDMTPADDPWLYFDPSNPNAKYS